MDFSKIKSMLSDLNSTLQKNDIDPFQTKVKYLYASPYDYTLFIDTDTQVIQPIYEIFLFLKK